ncbi:MAG: PQQ-dependent sugar dehydrogenase [bacterium]|nr:PQQ-dependent sugar dehydrogenase [bacterium]
MIKSSAIFCFERRHVAKRLDIIRYISIIKSIMKMKLIVTVLSLFLLAPSVILALQDNKVDPGAISVDDGYKVEAIITGLSVPTTAIFDGEDLIIAESGFKNAANPRVLKITKTGEVTVLVETGLETPVTGLLVDEGILYISHKGKISRLEKDGKMTDIITGLPSEGDHQNNNIALGGDGRIYVGQGTVTNSGVIGEDNYIFGWLEKNPNIHDIPCFDITLTGKNYETDNPLTEADDKVLTGAYKPFGTPSTEGEIIKGETKCNGSILSFNKDGSDLKVVASGLRNPFGLEFDAAGKLWATFHGADVRGSRNIFNDADYLVEIKEGAWYGWPDFFEGKPVTDSRFKGPSNEQPTFLLKTHPKLALPFATFDSHTATNGLTFSKSDQFGFNGDAFIATFGTFAPITSGLNVELSGFSVLRVNMKNGEINKFANNKIPGPSYLNRQGGFNRPSDVVFGPDESLYVVDWGASKLGDKGLELKPETGIVWRIYNTSTQVPRSLNGPIVVEASPTLDNDREPEVKNSSEIYKMILVRFWPLVALIFIIALIIWIKKRK